eukprot:6474028-Amphidinium_carterae.2
MVAFVETFQKLLSIGYCFTGFVWWIQKSIGHQLASCYKKRGTTVDPTRQCFRVRYWVAAVLLSNLCYAEP